MATGSASLPTRWCAQNLQTPGSLASAVRELDGDHDSAKPVRMEEPKDPWRHSSATRSRTRSTAPKSDSATSVRSCS
jgi:hypothetical protein